MTGERSRINLQLAEKVDELATFYSMSSALQQTMDLDDRLRVILKTVTTGGGFDRATVFLFDDRKGILTNGLATNGSSMVSLDGVRVPVSRKSFDDRGAIANGLVEVLTDLSMPEVVGNKFSVFTPLLAKGRPVGLIIADNSESKRGVTGKRRRFLEVLANLAALAIEHARLHDNLKSLAVRDSLTGLFNRRRFDEQLGWEVERARRYKRLLSLVMIDLDHFKDYNDVNGHPAGDRVLVKVARILRGGVRVADTVARYGGDEFADILPETGGGGALAFGERIRGGVSKIISGGESLDSGNGLSVCLGISTYPEDAHSAKGLVDRADRALYLAKQSGRNKVSLFNKGDARKDVDNSGRSVVKSP